MTSLEGWGSTIELHPRGAESATDDGGERAAIWCHAAPARSQPARFGGVSRQGITSGLDKHQSPSPR